MRQNVLTLFTSQILVALLRLFGGGLEASCAFLFHHRATIRTFLLLGHIQVLSLRMSSSLRRPIQVYLALFGVRETLTIGHNQPGRLHVKVP